MSVLFSALAQKIMLNSNPSYDGQGIYDQKQAHHHDNVHIHSHHSFGFFGGQAKIATTATAMILNHIINFTIFGNSKKNLLAKAAATAIFNRSNSVLAISSLLKSVKMGFHISVGLIVRVFARLFALI